jgi:hypothetical protein
MTDLSAAAAPNEYFLAGAQDANSTAEALEKAVAWALSVIDRVGLPPHGIQLGENELRRRATVIPDREAFHEGYGEAVDKHLRRGAGRVVERLPDVKILSFNVHRKKP